MRRLVAIVSVFLGLASAAAASAEPGLLDGAVGDLAGGAADVAAPVGSAAPQVSVPSFAAAAIAMPEPTSDAAPLGDELPAPVAITAAGASAPTSLTLVLAVLAVFIALMAPLLGRRLRLLPARARPPALVFAVEPPG